MGDAAEILMRKLGLTMTEGRIARWVVAPGTRFAAGDVIVEIETDKIVNEVEAPAAGTVLALLEAEGTTTAVGTPIARWQPAGPADRPPAAGGERADLPQSEAAPRAAGVQPALPAKPAASSSRRRSTPFARKLAKDARLDLADVEGTGPGGRIKAADVERALRSGRTVVSSVPVLVSSQPGPPWPAGREVSLAIADIDIARLGEVEQRLSRTMPRLALDRRHYVALACIRALAAQSESRDAAAIGFEFDTPQGPALLTLVAERRATLSALAGGLADLERRASEGRLQPRERNGGDVAVLAGNHAARVFGPALPASGRWR